MVGGLGGIFIKANDPRYLARWYDDNLGIGFGTTLYFSFKWREHENPSYIAHTVFSFFDENTTYFYPGTNDVMINLRVNNLDELRIQLRNDNTQVIDKIETYEYGRFGWVLDPDGNKIELWEPNDDGFEDRNKQMDLRGVTGLGGIYLKTPAMQTSINWYKKHFGLFEESGVHSFAWKDLNTQTDGITSLSFYPDDTTYFQPSAKDFMLSFRVADLKTVMENLKDTEAKILEPFQEYSHGKFGWFLDPEENKVELWEVPR